MYTVQIHSTRIQYTLYTNHNTHVHIYEYLYCNIVLTSSNQLQRHYQYLTKGLNLESIKLFCIENEALLEEKAMLKIFNILTKRKRNISTTSKVTCDIFFRSCKRMS